MAVPRTRLVSVGPMLLLAVGLGFCLGSWFESRTRELPAAAFVHLPWVKRWSLSPLSYSSQSVTARPSGQRVARPASLVGSEAPGFTAKAVVEQDFVDVSLSQYRGKKYVVLFFYPLDFTFVCPTEIIAFSDRVAEFKALGTEILGVSVDSEYAHLAWIQTPRDDGGLGELEYPLVSDLKKEIASSYGVLSPDGVSYRGLFIIDKEGIVQHSTVNNMAFGRNVDEVLRVLQAIIYVQSNPDEVCPAGWQPGDKTMKPDQEGKKEYFQNK